MDQLDPRDRGLQSKDVLQASDALAMDLLIRYGDPAVADAFAASRLTGDWGHAFGTLPSGADLGRIIERHQPVA